LLIAKTFYVKKTCNATSLTVEFEEMVLKYSLFGLRIFQSFSKFCFYFEAHQSVFVSFYF